MSEKLQSHIEALLLAHGEPIALSKLAKALKEKEETVRGAVENLRQEYLEEGRGFAIVENDLAYQLVSSPDSAEYVRKLVKQEESSALSPAMLEVLSVVAYRGPVTRAEIDSIRGVNSSHVLRALAIRGLVNRGEDAEDARTYRYTVSFDFLRLLGLEQAGELPEYESLRDK